MPSYMTVGGLTIPIAEKVNPSYTHQEMGVRTRGPRGVARKYVRKQLLQWDLSTVDITYEMCLALHNLFLGRGHVFQINKTLHSQSGLRIAPKYTEALQFLPGGGVNADALRVISGSGANIEGLGDVWTVLLRYYDTIAAEWRFVGEDVDGNQWIDGVSSAFTNYMFSDSSGTLVLNGKDRVNTNANLDIDELVILPWKAPDLFMTSWTANASPFSPLPKLYIEGDIGSFTAQSDAGEIEESTKDGYARMQFGLQTDYLP